MQCKFALEVYLTYALRKIEQEGVSEWFVLIGCRHYWMLCPALELMKHDHVPPVIEACLVRHCRIVRLAIATSFDLADEYKLHSVDIIVARSLAAVTITQPARPILPLHTASSAGVLYTAID